MGGTHLRERVAVCLEGELGKWYVGVGSVVALGLAAAGFPNAGGVAGALLVSAVVARTGRATRLAVPPRREAEAPSYPGLTGGADAGLAAVQVATELGLAACAGWLLAGENIMSTGSRGGTHLPELRAALGSRGAPSRASKEPDWPGFASDLVRWHGACDGAARRWVGRRICEVLTYGGQLQEADRPALRTLLGANFVDRQDEELVTYLGHRLAASGAWEAAIWCLEGGGASGGPGPYRREQGTEMPAARLPLWVSAKLELGSSPGSVRARVERWVSGVDGGATFEPLHAELWIAYFEGAGDVIAALLGKIRDVPAPGQEARRNYHEGVWRIWSATLALQRRQWADAEEHLLELGTMGPTWESMVAHTWTTIAMERGTPDPDTTLERFASLPDLDRAQQADLIALMAQRSLQKGDREGARRQADLAVRACAGGRGSALRTIARAVRVALAAGAGEDRWRSQASAVEERLGHEHPWVAEMRRPWQ